MSQLVVSCTAGDCWADKSNNFDATGTVVYVIDQPGVVNANVRSWFPFTVNLRNVVVSSAFITIRSTANSSAGSGSIRLACEAADNPSTPASGADLNARSITSFTHTGTISGAWVLDTEYTFQIDNAVQEILQRSGWAVGNTMAVIIDDVDLGDTARSVYSYESASPTYRAYLTINYTGYIPRSLGAV